MLKKISSVVGALMVCMGTQTAVAQAPGRPADTSARPGAARAAAAAPKPYKEVITDKAVTRNGYFKVHKLDDRYFFEIPDALLGRDILVVNRISKTQAGAGYGGDEIGQNIIRFEKGPKHKLFLRNISYAVYAKDSSSPMFASVSNSNIQLIAAAFDVKAYSNDKKGSVIDMTDYIGGDNDILFFNGTNKIQFKLGALQNDKSYIEDVKAFPLNIEIKTVKTYTRTQQSTGAGQAGSTARGGQQSRNLTVELNSSLVLLPEQPMQPRYFDERVGYFNVGYTDFDANPQGVKAIRMIKRWRLEPREEDLEKYKRGELVEPKKPIVFYIDPATPKKWVPYLIQGVNDWQVAFEKAGFKNAIIGKMAPTPQEDSTWSLEDARHSAIVYKPSPIPNASGPSIADPRSGEIIESHINWYHNIMELVRNWYIIQAGVNDPRAQKMELPDELMGQLIRFVSSHEVGHTLGLRHNFGSSSTVPVELLRNKNWVEANGHTPSIMDYARFNYVAQPEDNIAVEGIFPRIGEYDKWAIEWGYRYFPQYKSADDELGHVSKWVSEKLKDRRLWWGDGEGYRDDPRSQTEDLGDDAMKAGQYGIKNLQRIVPKLMEWTKVPNTNYSNLWGIYDQLTQQFGRYLGHVSRNIGGVYKTPKVVEEEGPVFEYVPREKQASAVAFLNQQIFATPEWLIDKNISAKTGANPVTIIAGLQDDVLSSLLNTQTFMKLIRADAALGNNAYRMTDLLNDLKKGIWGELKTNKSISIYRRNLQKSYITQIETLLKPPATGQASNASGVTMGVKVNNTDIFSVLRAHLVGLKNEINAAKAAATDTMSRYHLQDCARRIDEILNPSK